jgi:DNA anti-recombination protein RmuC
MNKLFIGTIVSVGLAAATPLLLAQSTGGTTNAPQAPQMQQHRHMQHMQRPFSRPSERIEARLAYLKTALKITDAQQSQWDAFASVLRKQAGNMEQRMQAWHAKMDQQKPQHVTAIDRLERRQAMLTAASQNLQEVIAAAKPLYAVLTPEQQQIADQLLARRGHRGGFRQHGGMHRGA